MIFVPVILFLGRKKSVNEIGPVNAYFRRLEFMVTGRKNYLFL